MDRIRQGLIKLLDFVKLNLGDILILIGIISICVASFLINLVIGLYVSGILLTLLGLFFSKYPLKER